MEAGGSKLSGGSVKCPNSPKSLCDVCQFAEQPPEKVQSAGNSVFYFFFFFFFNVFLSLPFGG